MMGRFICEWRRGDGLDSEEKEEFRVLLYGVRRVSISSTSLSRYFE